MKGSHIFTKNHTTHKLKDTLFKSLFSDKKEALELYEMISGTKLNSNVKYESCVIEDKSLIALKNDIAFQLDDNLVILVEHQSSWDENMPLRMLAYYALTLMSVFVKGKDSISNSLKKIPTPKFYVLFNGLKPNLPNEMRLSNSFIDNNDKLQLDLIVKVIDIRHGRHSFKKNTALTGYSTLIYYIESYIKSGLDRDKAVKLAVDRCIKENILREFLQETYKEVINLLSQEYTIEDLIEVREKDAEIKGVVKILLRFNKDLETIAKEVNLPTYQVEVIIKEIQEELEGGY